ncbi:MAG: hypothetical protein H6737_14385 [Alphaproteobacteria bacterium]|nr:hypothetical protein [Alphaproteobacteria bacterium]
MRIALSALVVALLGCSGLTGSPCDPLLTESDLLELAPGTVLRPDGGYSGTGSCTHGFLPEGTYQTWAKVEARDLGGYADTARLDPHHRERGWLRIQQLEGDGWTAELAEAPQDQEAVEAEAARLLQEVEDLAARLERGEAIDLPRDPMGAMLNGLPPEQHVWVVVGPTWRAEFMLDRDVVRGDALEAFVKKTAARVP